MKTPTAASGGVSVNQRKTKDRNRLFAPRGGELDPSQIKLLHTEDGCLALKQYDTLLHFTDYDYRFIKHYLTFGATHLITKAQEVLGAQRGTYVYSRTRKRLSRFLDSLQGRTYEGIEKTEHIFHNVLETPIPLYSTVFLTYHCNYRCSFCDYGKLLDYSLTPLPLADWQEILLSLFRMGCHSVVLTGGEPTTHSDFLNIARYASNLGLNLLIFTRKAFSSNEIKNLSSLRIESVMIGLDTCSKEIAQTLYGGRVNPEMSLKSIEYLREARIPVDVSIVVIDGINQNIKELFFKCANLGVRSIVVTHPRGSVESVPTPDSYWTSLANAYGLQISIKKSEEPREAICTSCNVGKTRCILDPSGNILFCDQPSYLTTYHSDNNYLDKFCLKSWIELQDGFNSWLSQT